MLAKGSSSRSRKRFWDYNVDGKQVVLQWFSYRKRDRSKPAMGDKRPPSPLQSIQPEHWLAEYTNDLIDLLNVLTLLVALEPEQARLLDDVCAGASICEADLLADGALRKSADGVGATSAIVRKQMDMF
jgi:hypothetical protein